MLKEIVPKNVQKDEEGDWYRKRKLVTELSKASQKHMSYGSSTSSRKPWRWVRLDLVFTKRHICYASIPTWTHS